MRTLVLVAIAASLAACRHGSDAAVPPTKGPEADANTDADANHEPDADRETNAVHPFCGSADEERLRAAFPAIPRCGGRVSFGFVEATVSGHALVVVGFGYDPCCTDIAGAEGAAGTQIYLDGVARDLSHPKWDDLDPGSLDKAATQALLQAILLSRGAVEQVVTADEQAKLQTDWPATANALAARPAGFEATPTGYRLRVWSASFFSERGIDCHYLEGLEAAVDGGQITFGQPVGYAEGTQMGRPCGDPLP